MAISGKAKPPISGKNVKVGEGLLLVVCLALISIYISSVHIHGIKPKPYDGGLSLSYNDQHLKEEEEEKIPAALLRLEPFQPKRGVRYLYETYGLLLSADNVVKNSNEIIVRHIGSRPVDCTGMNINLWFRIAGPEIVSALVNRTTDGSKCEWIFRHRPLMAGTYELAIKTYAIDDGADFQYGVTETGVYWTEAVVLQKYKAPNTFYSGPASCYIQCTRHENCTHWTLFGNNPCILYSSVLGKAHTTESTNVTQILLNQRRMLRKAKDGKARSRRKRPATKSGNNDIGVLSGKTGPKDTPGHYYLGCGWSVTLEMDMCLDAGNDDMVYTSTPTFEVSPADGSGEYDETTMSICPSTLEGVGDGRWVQSDPSLQCAHKPVIPENHFHQSFHNASQPEDCWIHDDMKLTGKQCIEGCARFTNSSIWKSSLFHERFKYVWKPYSCRLPLYTDQMLKTCFETKNYASPEVHGDSVAGSFKSYVKMRFEDLQDTVQFGATPVWLSNLDMTHVIWHNNNTALASKCKKLSHSASEREAADSNVRLVWLLGPHFSSEREANVMTGRLRAGADIIRPCMEAKQWHEVDWINASMALAIEFSTRLDGLHSVGPSMKILFNMVMHNLCSDTISPETIPS